MGKYTKKGKLTTNVVAVMDVSHSSLGVRTRATTLALQRAQPSRTTSTPPPPPEPEPERRELSYLQLRSRKLEKPPLQNPNPRLVTSRLAIRSCGSVSAGSGSSNRGVRASIVGNTEDCCEFGGEETCCGENYVDFDGRVDRERSTRESTPCSFTWESNDYTTPSSCTRHTITPKSLHRIMPSAQEIEGFFARHAHEQQRLFTEKYNFDIVNEKPLQGRYEWVKVQP